MEKKGIALFDSGVGGLTVLRALQQNFPYEKFYYLADTLHLPYGNKSASHIQELSQKNASFLMNFPLKALIIACHTASALAYQVLLNRFNLPVFEVISPAVDQALKVSKNKRIAVLGTESLVQSHVYELSLKKKEPNCAVFSIACPLLVPLIEENLLQASLSSKVVKHYLSALTNTSIDTLILGCTHYPFLKTMIQKELGDQVQIIDPAFTLSESLKAYFFENDLLNPLKKNQLAEFYVSGCKRDFQEKTKALLNQNLLNIKTFKI